MPLAVISYTPKFTEVHDYFRAVQQRGELSERALSLTSDVIDQNSANYTAWYYRRRCLKSIGSDLMVELSFTDGWARECPKNYQVWYHRRWLINEIASQIGDTEGSSEDIADQLKALGERELEYHFDVMQVNDDYKNYNGWSHRQYIAKKFNLWGLELPFVEDLLRDDIRNNSAWNHRFTVLRQSSWPMNDTVRMREVEFTLDALRRCANNESAWNYLSAFFGDGDGQVPWDSIPVVESFCQEVLSLAPEKDDRCRFAMEALAHVFEARGEVEQALSLYADLANIDKIRRKYWDWRSDLLKSKSKRESASSGT